MAPKLGSFIASLALAALTFGLSTPALADVAPPPDEKPVVEQPPVEPPATPEPETKPETKPDDAKADKPADAKAEKAAEKTGKCSISDAPEQGLAGFALAVLLLSGVALGRRRA